MIAFRPDALDRLGETLCETAAWWQASVFGETPRWALGQPALASALEKLSDTQLEHFEAQPAQAAAWLARWLPDLGQLDAQVASVDTTPLPAPLPLSEAEGRDIKGRKWQQILHFAAMHEQLPLATTTLLEWCAGKAHLGRLLAKRQGRALLAVEWQATLCNEAERHAQRDGVALSARQANVLTSEVPALLQGSQEVVALHACGDLHRRLLQALPATPRVERLSLAPCCYHLTAHQRYQPLSARAAVRGPDLTRQQLHLVTQQPVVVGRTKLARTRELMRWRLAFNRLQKQWRSTEQNLSTPSRPLRVLKTGFEAFVADMAKHHGIPVPSRVDYASALDAGARDLAKSRRYALVRHRFRRALEVWLLMDRAAYLQEQGFEVSLGRFCPFHVTPRNLIIQAGR